MSKKKILIVIILIFAMSAVGIYFFKNMQIKTFIKDYEIEKIEKYNYFPLKTGEKYGVIDVKGNIIIETKFQKVVIPNPSRDFFICYTDEKATVFNSKNQEILSEYIIEPIKLKNIVTDLVYEKSVLIYKENEKYGIIDFEGNRLTEAIYDSIESLTYKEGELVTKKNDKYGVINIKGYTIIDNLYDEILADMTILNNENKKQGYIVENKTKDGIKCGYIDYEGKMKLQVEYNEIVKINDENDIYLIVSKNGKYGFFKNYETIIDFDYQSIEYNEDNKMLFLNRGTQFGASDLNGNIKIPVKYLTIESRGKFIYVTTQNEKIVYDFNGIERNIDFDTIITETENVNYNIIIKNEDSKSIYGVVDKEENQIIPIEYTYLEYAYNDFFIACKEDGKFGVVNVNNGIIVNFEYDLIQKINNRNILQALNTDSSITTIYSSNLENTLKIKNANINIEEEYVKIYSNDDLIYLDNNGNIIENNKLFDNKIFAIKDGEKWGFKDKKGNYIVEAKYDRTTDFNKYGYAAIKKDNKWGAINEEGKIIIEPTYEIDSDNIEIDFIDKYYKIQSDFGEIYYTDDM